MSDPFSSTIGDPKVSAPQVTEQEVARGAATALMARLGAVIEVISQPAYTWMFSVATYGVYTVLWAAVTLGSNIFDIASTTVLQRVIPQARTDEEAHAALKIALGFTALITSFVALVVTISAPFLASFVNAAPRDQDSLALAIALFAWALPLWTLIEVCGAAMRARRAFGPEIRLKVFYEQAGRLAAAVACFLIGFKSLGLVVAHLLSLLLIGGLSVRLLSRYYSLRLIWSARIPAGLTQEMMSFGFAILPANILRRALSDLPPMALNMMLPGAQGATAAALYGIARKVASILQMVRLSFGYVMAPLASAQAAAVDVRAIQPIYGFATRLATCGIMPLTAALIILGPDMLRLFAPEARAAFPLLVILTVGRCLEALSGPGASILEVIGKRRLTIINSVIGLVGWTTTAFLFTPLWGASGMAVSVALALNLTAFLALFQLYQSQGIHPFAAPFLRTLSVSIGAAIAMLLVEAVLRQMGSATVASLISGGCVFPALWVTMRYGLPTVDRKALGSFGNWLSLKV